MKDATYRQRKAPAQSRKKPDKDQFVTKALSLPDVIDHSACWTAYQLDQERCLLHIPPNPRTQNCKNNPYCIHRLGLEKIEKLKQKNGNPSTDIIRRETDKQPCGLVNMGNYCYMNSFLQIWFNDLVFRQGIYDWTPDPDFVKPVNAKMDVQAVMACMQELFVRMQITPFDTTDANQLSDLLKLDNEQHDVQEFTILFFEALDRNLAQHPNGQAFRNMLRKRFEGKIMQTIECTCGRRSETQTPLRSLQIIIEGFKSLTKAIENCFKAENLSDYKCDQCQQVGNVVRRTAPVELPPVLMIPLSRYIYDERGQSKKLKHPIQYPRVLEERQLNPEAEQNREYELSAVMIHEGPNTYCGHYYDLVKDPVTNKWFTYNDRSVDEFKPAPGVVVEKESIGRGTPDMKGCYALIYRRTEPEDPHSTDALRLPPPSVVSKIEEELNQEFLKETSEGNRAHNLWSGRLEERSNLLQALWKALEVRNGKDMKRKAGQIAFLPTALLTEILEKEFKAIQNKKEPNAAKKNQAKCQDVPPAEDDIEQALRELEQEGQRKEELDDDFIERLNEIVAKKDAVGYSPAPDSQQDVHEELSDDDLKSVLYALEDIGDTSMRLCAHGKLSLDAMYKNEMKAVNLLAAQQLLQSYNLAVSIEECSEADDGQETSSVVSAIRSGNDLCIDCVMLLKKEAEFKQRLEHTLATVVEPIQKNIKQRLYDPVKETVVPEQPAPDDAVWVARPLLTSYRKLAVQQLEFLKSSNRSSTTLKFSTTGIGLNKGTRANGNGSGDSSIDVDQPLSNKATKRKKSNSLDENKVLNEFLYLDTDDVENTKPMKNGQSADEQLQPPAVKKHAGARQSLRKCSESESDVQSNGFASPTKSPKLSQSLMSPAKGNGGITLKNRFSMLPEETGVATNGHTDARAGSSESGDSSIEVLDHKPPTGSQPGDGPMDQQAGPSKRDESPDDMEVAEDADDARSSSSSVKEIDPDRPASGLSMGKGEAQSVFFNKELLCDHGGLNCTTKRVWMKRGEWEELVKVFDEYNTVPMLEPECEICRQQHSANVMARDDVREKFNNIQLAVGKLGRQIEKRVVSPEELGVVYTRVVCSRFLQLLRQNNKMKSVTIPTICQTCFFCAPHDLPYLPVPAPDTVTEKEGINYPVPVTEDEWLQLLGAIENFAPDQPKPMEVVINEGGFELFCNDCYRDYCDAENSKRFVYPTGGDVYVRLQEDKGDDSKETAAERPATTNVTTRRGKAKDIIRIRIASTATVKDLKLRLYQRTNQTPNDQLILMGNNALEDNQTLEDARVSSNNSDDPLVLIVQQPTEIIDEQRPIEKGFRDTALAT